MGKIIFNDNFSLSVFLSDSKTESHSKLVQKKFVFLFLLRESIRIYPLFEDHLLIFMSLGKKKKSQKIKSENMYTYLPPVYYYYLNTED